MSKLKFFCWPDGYLPEWRAGAQITLHELMRHMIGRGHDCVVYKKPNEQLGYLEQVRLTSNSDEALDADVLIAQGPHIHKKIQLARKVRKPLIFIKHTIRKLKIPSDVNIVYNANATWNMFRVIYPDNNCIVVHPPIDQEKYKTDSSRTHITLVNLNDNKGGDILAEIAKAMPDRKFLGVRGGYGDQHNEFPKNVELIDLLEDMREAYSKTKILLIPSKAETYGRTAIEAMVCGIPSICEPLPGLIENCSSSAIYANRSNVTSYVRAIKEMESNYDFWSRKAFDRFNEIEELKNRELDLFETFCIEVSNGSRNNSSFD